MCFWCNVDETKLLSEKNKLESKIKELESLNKGLKDTIDDMKNFKNSFHMSNLPLDNIKVGSKLINVNFRCKVSTEDYKPYNRIVGVVGNKYTIFEADGTITDIKLVNSLQEVVDYCKQNFYIVCEY